MKEGLPIERSPNPEEPRFEIVNVTSENIQELENIRRATDDNIDEEKFKLELEHYGFGSDHGAFLIRDAEGVFGYVEMDAVADYIPKGADRELCDDKETFDALKGWARIGRIGLKDEYIGKRIGNRLLDQAEKWAQSHGQSVMWLDYLAANQKLETFYTSAGYRTLVDFRDGDKDRLRRIAVKHL